MVYMMCLQISWRWRKLGHVQVGMWSRVTVYTLPVDPASWNGRASCSEEQHEREPGRGLGVRSRIMVSRMALPRLSCSGSGHLLRVRNRRFSVVLLGAIVQFRVVCVKRDQRSRRVLCFMGPAVVAAAVLWAIAEGSL